MRSPCSLCVHPLLRTSECLIETSRKRLKNSSARPNSQGTEAGRRRDQKKKRRNKYHVAMPFARAIIDVKDMPHWRRRNGRTPVGYSERSHLRRDQCDMTPESRNSEARRVGHF
jgi:hypothetical protein